MSRTYCHRLLGGCKHQAEESISIATTPLWQDPTLTFWSEFVDVMSMNLLCRNLSG